MRIKLPAVTLVAADSICGPLMELAIDECSRRVQFRTAIILDGPGIKSLNDWSRTIWYDIPPMVETSHMLVIQWDSWVVNAQAWRDDWLDYDYIGAPWHWHPEGQNVGNGGFSLRSKRLMEFLGKNREIMPCVEPEDDRLCRRYRPRLEAEGFKFAPYKVAEDFSFERMLRYLDLETGNLPFGFHGMFNWPYVLDDKAIADRLAMAPPYVLESLHCAQMRKIMEQRR